MFTDDIYNVEIKNNKILLFLSRPFKKVEMNFGKVSYIILMLLNIIFYICAFE